MARVFVTGANGFLGANLIRALLEKGHAVSALIRPASDTWRLTDVLTKIEVHTGDLQDVEDLMRILREAKPEVIYNLAGAGVASRARASDQELVNTNLLGLINLAESLEGISYQALIQVGSSLEYGAKDSVLAEGDSCEPMNTYAITKLAATRYGAYLGKVKGKPVLVFRCFSLFGPYDDPLRIVPKTLLSFIRGTAPSLMNPKAVRDFIFVQDAVELLIEGMDRAEELKGEIFNVGTGNEKTLEDVVSAAQGVAGSATAASWGEMPARAGEPKVAAADMTKTFETFSWHPKHSLEEGLQETHAWFKRNLASYADFSV